MDELEDLLQRTKPTGLYVSENPYASLSDGDDEDDSGLLRMPEVLPMSLAPRPHDGKPHSNRSLSKAAFRSRATQIFEKYVPRHEQRRLRSHHRDFIVRNEARPGEFRARVIEELSRYDLSSLKSVKPHFNRELPDDLGEKKLQDLEAKILIEFPGL